MAAYKDYLNHDPLPGEGTAAYFARVSEYLLQLEADMGVVEQDAWADMMRRHTARRFSEENPAVSSHVVVQAEAKDCNYAVHDMAAERKETDLQSGRDLVAFEMAMLQRAKDELLRLDSEYEQTMAATAKHLMDDH